MESIIKYGFILSFWLMFGSLGSGVPACLWDQWMVAVRPTMVHLTLVLGGLWLVFVIRQFWYRKKVRFWRYFLGFGFVYLILIFKIMSLGIQNNPIPNPPYISRLEREEMRDHFILRWMLQYPCIDKENNHYLYFDTTNNMMLAIMDSDYDLALTNGSPSWENCRLRTSDGVSIPFFPQKNHVLIFHKGTFRSIPIPPGVVSEQIYNDFMTYRTIPELVTFQLKKSGIADIHFIE